MEFNGFLLEEEFKGIALDNFHENATIFFLSHFHSDHCKGLKEYSFKEYFDKNDVRLYCSEITKELVKKHGKLCDDKIIVLKEEPIMFELNNEAIKIYPLRAGHCPGSLMFLFECSSKKVLFTGDFRLSTQDIKKIQLCEPPKPIKLDTLYLDTTFGSPSFKSFPSRETSFNHITKIMKDNLAINKKYLFYFPISSYIGYEGLMVQLYKEFKKKIWVHENVVHEYTSCISQLVNVITSDHFETNVFFFYKNKMDILPKIEDPEVIIRIIPSAMWFNKFNLAKGSVQRTRENEWRVAYSNHASLEEIVKLVEYTSPTKIIPIAKALYITPNCFKPSYPFNETKMEHAEMIKEIYAYSRPEQEHNTEESDNIRFIKKLQARWQEEEDLLSQLLD